MPYMLLALGMLALAVPANPPASGAHEWAECPETGDFEALLTCHVERAMSELGDVPGLAVAVVRDRDIVYARGFGERDREAGLPLTPETVFYTASHSKSLTAATAALLAHEGVLDLDAPISRYLAELSFRDPGLSADSITMRDLLTHTSGIVNPAITWRTSYTGQHTTDELLRVLEKYSTPAPRSFQYTNVGYVLVGIVLERLMGADWRHVVADRILRPLAMEHTTGFVTEVERRGWPLALPYSALGNPPHNVGTLELERIPFWKTNLTIQGAGGHMSTVLDLARWVELHLNDGRLDDRQILPASVIRSVRRPHAELDATFYRFHRTGYGLGWYVAEHQDEALIHHFGGFAGYRTHVSFMPERGVGVVAIVNEISAGFLLPDFVASCAYALILEKDAAGRRCESEREELVLGVREGLEETRRGFEARPNAPPRALDDYTGRYCHPALGTMAIARRGAELHAVLGLVETVVDAWEGDVLRMEFGGAGTPLHFHFDNEAESAAAVELQGYRMERVESKSPVKRCTSV